MSSELLYLWLQRSEQTLSYFYTLFLRGRDDEKPKKD